MKQSNLVPLFSIFVFLTASVALAQQASVVHRHSAPWTCHGQMWLENSNIYCKDFKTKELSKTNLDGQEIFSRLQTPAVGGSTRILAVAEDSSGDVYAVDGVHVQEYSSTGQYKKTITPGIQMASGLVILDPEHIYVSGHTPWRQTGPSASLFLVNSSGIQKSFSSAFFPDKTGLEGLMLNMPSLLALDRKKQVLYQLSPNLYEIRVFNLAGNQIRTIIPPKQYVTRPPNVEHHPDGGVGIGPSDTLDDIAVLANGGIAVTGGRLDSSGVEGRNINVSYTRFLDLYDSAGNFQRRIQDPDLRLEGAPFRMVDHRTGRAYYGRSGTGLEADLSGQSSVAKK